MTRADSERQSTFAVRQRLQHGHFNLPLRRAQWDDYLQWAVQAFRVASAGVRDDVQIHTHMCYSEFNDILPAIAALDADAITIETSRSDMKLLEGFGCFKYPNEIGPGVYDIHSPRMPGTVEMLQLLDKAVRVIDPSRLWINPDCGLKNPRLAGNRRRASVNTRRAGSGRPSP